MKCPACNKSNRKNAVFCLYCGANLPGAHNEKPGNITKDARVALMAAIGLGLVILVITGLLVFKPSNPTSKNSGITNIRDSEIKGMWFCFDKNNALYALSGDKAYLIEDSSGNADGYPYVYLFNDDQIYLKNNFTIDERFSSWYVDLSVTTIDGNEKKIDEYVDYLGLKKYGENIWYIRLDGDSQSICYYTGRETVKVVGDLKYIIGYDVEHHSGYEVDESTGDLYYMQYFGDDASVLYYVKNGKKKELYSDNDPDESTSISSKNGQIYFEITNFNRKSGKFYFLNDGKLKFAGNFIAWPKYYGDKIVYVNLQGNLVVMNSHGKKKTFYGFKAVEKKLYNIFGFEALNKETNEMFFVSDDDLYMLELSKSLWQLEMKRIVKNYPEDGNESQFASDMQTLYVINTRKLESIDISSGNLNELETENSVKKLLTLRDTHFEGCIYIDNQNAMYLLDGNTSVLLDKDANIDPDAEVVFDGTKVVWLDDQSLMICDLSGDNKSTVATNVERIYYTPFESLYFLTSDYVLWSLNDNMDTMPLITDAYSMYLNYYHY